MRRTVGWCLAIGGLVLVPVAAVAASAQAPAGAAVQIGHPAPDFAADGLSGETVALSHYRGRPVVIHFFASWLGGSCWQGMIRLDDAAAEYEHQGLVVVGVAARDSAEAVDHMVNRLGLTFPIALDPYSEITVNRYGISKIPTTVFVDRQGVVWEVLVGPIDEESLLGLIAEIL